MPPSPFIGSLARLLATQPGRQACHSHMQVNNRKSERLYKGEVPQAEDLGFDDVYNVRLGLPAPPVPTATA